MSWTGKRMAILAALIFAAHVAGIFALHTPEPMVALPENFRTTRVKSPSLVTNALEGLEGLNDPLVFAGAHQHGFSALAWMTRPRQDYALTNAKLPPRFLTFARTPMKSPQGQAETIAQAPTRLPFLEIALAREQPKSVMRVRGELEGRALLKIPEIPVQMASDVLSNTVVQLAVQANGFPFSARIVSRSGSRQADLRALQIANGLKFAPLSAAVDRDSAEFQWGDCVFQWFTTEPSATNAPVSANSAQR